MMLVDTGAVRPIFALSGEDRKHSPDVAVFLTAAANGSPILSYGTRLLSNSILGRRYSWDFVVEDIRTPLLGVDNLAHFGLAVEVGRKRLLDTDSCQSLPLATGPSAPTICSIAPHQYAQLLKEVPDIFRPELRQVPRAPAKHGIYHHIKMKGPLQMQGYRGFPLGTFRRPRTPSPKWNRWEYSHKEHQRHIRAVLQRLQENGLVVRFDKCTFGAEKADFLGHEISPNGVRLLTSKVAAITRFPVPTSVKAIQEFLGMVNYYRRFIPETAHPMAPLTEILKGKPKSLVCGPSQQQALSLTKAALAEATALAHQDPSAPLQLTMDASSIACGAVLEQIVDGAPPPTSPLHSSAKSSTPRRPATAPLTGNSAQYTGQSSTSSSSWRSSPAQSNTPPGSKNSVADALSRIELNAVQLVINYEDLTWEQATDPETPAYRTAIMSLKWRDVSLAPVTTRYSTSSMGSPTPPAGRQPSC
ncbi:uncharacterized protein [Macrobrachium rosenbergii]|uniref:uncharacterized protein n=1 Tax=Macrobrachium rosenbergii TaxID=79674 RepID=UPI0034D70F27